MSHDGKILDSNTVRFERLLPGPIELAWDYLTEPELLATWFAEATMEPRVGGALEVRFGPEEQGDCNASSTRGVIRAFQPPRLLAYSWMPRRQLPDGSVETTDEGEVRFELAARGDKVQLTLTHTRIPTPELGGYAGGWHAFLDGLESRMTKGEAVPVGEIYGHVHPSYDSAVAAIAQRGARP